MSITSSRLESDHPGGKLQPPRAYELAIAILTFQRNSELREHLPHIVEHARLLNAERHGQVVASVIVVDNDPSGSAREVIEDLRLGVRYVCEPTPGIAAARNRAVDEAAGMDLLVFIDDDERPLPGWLPSLIDVWNTSRPAAVPGRVLPRYKATPNRWLLAGGFFDRPVRATGTRMPAAAAGNLLLDLRQIRESGLRFEEPFGPTGGEDSLFGKRLVQRGYKIVWCHESAVEDVVPPSRLTREWVLRRMWSQGNLISLIDCYIAESRVQQARVRAYRAAAGAALITLGVGRTVRGCLTGQISDRARGLGTIYRGGGMLAGACGYRYQQYSRTAPTQRPSIPPMKGAADA